MKINSVFSSIVRARLRSKDREKWISEKNIFCADDLRKYYSQWVSTREGGKTPISEQIPWISFEATDYLFKFLTSDMSVFEYGSGGSSIFFSKQVSRVCTVEHDSAWFEKVSLVMRELNVHNWEGRCIPPENGIVGRGRPEDPGDYYSSDFKQSNLEKYVRSIDAYPDGTFDLVLVDGRARPSCLMHAIPKVRVGGLLVLDNADRSYYTALTQDCILRFFHPVLDRPGPFPFVAEFLKTTIWAKHAVASLDHRRA